MMQTTDTVVKSQKRSSVRLADKTSRIRQQTGRMQKVTNQRCGAREAKLSIWHQTDRGEKRGPADRLKKKTTSWVEMLLTVTSKWNTSLTKPCQVQG
jgi:hypothetical protein